MQVEIDFKAECKAGEFVDSICVPVGPYLPKGVNGTGSASKGVRSQAEYLHTLRRCDESGCIELVRCRSTWRCSA